ncbi:MAG: dihydroorotate dehydrogenase electron transfer subunit [Proteobacteria bacterium]|nr:dihydroorotate dehydrogenase electron transfer subunit [Pseudomonadota bacterium]MBU1059045.1 dihydroorotate dehydrogenase electron transfer subunit [Pseudomonadota bacterium]
MSQIQEKTQVIRLEQLTSDIVRLTLEAPNIASIANPGQFVMIRTGNSNDPLLRRPFSISQTSSDGCFQILFKVVGRGTSLLSHCREGEYLSVLGPLGRGYRIDTQRRACLVGGGMGIAPLLFLGKRVLRKCPDLRPVVVLGAKNREELAPLIDDFAALGLKVHAATDDGSLGHHGLLTDVLKALDLGSRCMTYVCGPKQMMTAVHLFCRSMHYGCQVSVETSMACGMGACLGCIVPLEKGGYGHSCSDGPVFDAEDLVWTL